MDQQTRNNKIEMGQCGVTAVKEGGESKETTEISEEPSCRKLREMLVDIQITVNNILLENQ